MVFFKATDSWCPSIEEVEVERFTKASVWVKGRRQSRHSNWGSYFETREEAQEFLELKARTRIARAERNMKYAVEYQMKVQELRVV